MKKENLTPVCVYRNPEHEATTEAELKTAQKALQAVLDSWLSLGLGPCKDVSGLILRPRIMYDQAVSELIKVPESSGPFKLDKNKYRDQLTLPDPTGLLDARNEALKQSFCAMPELWTVSGDQVVLDEAEGKALIDSQSIYLSDPAKISLVENMIKLCELLNTLNAQTSGEMLPNSPASNEYFSDKFILRQEFDRSPFKIRVSPDYLRQLIQR